MFGSLGGAELILLFVLALLLFGPRRLPQIGKSVGKALSEFRRATTEFKGNLEREVRLSEIESARREISETVKEAKNLGVPRGSILSSEKPSDEVPSPAPSDATDTGKP